MAKLLDHLRQPVYGNAGIGRHANGFLFIGINHADLPLQQLTGGKTITHQRENPLTGRRQTHTGPTAHQHRKTKILFQTVHHMGQPRLGIAQHL